MAAPTFQAASAILAAQNGTADGTLTLPAHLADDVAIMHVMRRSLTNTVATPSGWTLIAGPFNGVAERHYIFGKRLVTSDTNPLLDWAATSGDWYAFCTTYRGCTTSGDPWEVVGSSAVGTSGTVTVSGITTLTAESLVVCCVGYGDDNNAVFAQTSTDPAAYTEHYVESAIGADGAIQISEGERATAGATGNITGTITVTAGDGWGGIALALIPPGAGGGGDTPHEATAGSYAKTGAAASLLRGLLVTAVAGSYAISGADAQTAVGRAHSANPGSYAVSGVSATTIVSTPNVVLSADSGSYVISGVSDTHLRTHVSSADAGSYSLSGTSATSPHGYLESSDPGSYAITGLSASTLRGHTESATAGGYSLSGVAAGTIKGSLLQAIAGAYGLTGSNAQTIHGTPNVVIVADSGLYSLSGSQASTLKGTQLSGDAGSYGLSGAPITTLYGRVFSALEGSYSLTGMDALTAFGGLTTDLLVVGFDRSGPRVVKQGSMAGARIRGRDGRGGSRGSDGSGSSIGGS